MHKTCMVVPCYNEARRIDQNSFLEFCDKYQNVDFVFVNDGSTDGTLTVLQEIEARNPDRFQILNFDKNSGKGHSVQKGMLIAMQDSSYSFMGFIDADLSAPLEELVYMLEILIKKPKAQSVFASRVKLLGNHIERNEWRHYLNRIFVTFSNTILKLRIYDSQCGLKLFRSDCIEKVFSVDFISKWFFDLEIILKLGEDNIIEVPINEWIKKDDSHLKFRDFLFAPLELLKIRKHYF